MCRQRNVTKEEKQKLLQRVAVMLEYITYFFTQLLAYSEDLTEGPFLMQILSFC